MKIWLDDKRHPPRQDMVLCTTFEGFIALVDFCVHEGVVIDYIGFDHDLGYEGKEGDEKNGYRAICYVEELVVDGKLTVKSMGCQSDNGPGRLKIEQAMRSIRKLQE